MMNVFSEIFVRQLLTESETLSAMITILIGLKSDKRASDFRKNLTSVI